MYCYEKYENSTVRDDLLAITNIILRFFIRKQNIIINNRHKDISNKNIILFNIILIVELYKFFFLLKNLISITKYLYIHFNLYVK